MGGCMALAQDHDRDRDANVRHAHTRVIRHRGGTQYITNYTYGDADDHRHRHHYTSHRDRDRVRDYDMDDRRYHDYDRVRDYDKGDYRTGSSYRYRSDRDRGWDMDNHRNRGLHKGWYKGRHNPHKGD